DDVRSDFHALTAMKIMMLLLSDISYLTVSSFSAKCFLLNLEFIGLMNLSAFEVCLAMNLQLKVYLELLNSLVKKKEHDSVVSFVLYKCIVYIFIRDSKSPHQCYLGVFYQFMASIILILLCAHVYI
ncbi:hypothetical protein ACJX0J_025463, partial [Zea mays]